MNTNVHKLWILVLWLPYNNQENCAHIVETPKHNISRFQRYTRCGIDQFTCKDGSCILDGMECNGMDDCPDGSDETYDCKYFPCNSFYGYRCDYGACVTKDAKCNGITECKDNSDETGCNRITSTHAAQRFCSVTKFTCKSGECIDNYRLCDGHGDCSDNSDETQECATFSCANAYRCKYGGCAVKDARCNGIQECVDGSDEERCPPTVFLSNKLSSDGSCIIPKVPNNGVFLNSNNGASIFKQGDLAPNLHALVTKCDRMFKTIPPNRSYPICIDEKWTLPPLECARYCQSISNDAQNKRTVVCKYNGTILDSCKEPIDGTIATVSCDFPYESSLPNAIRLCRDGTWDYPINECVPVCGQKPSTKTTNLGGKQKTKQGDYPWQVGIYVNDEHKTYICGGSILSERTILSGAHCFTSTIGNVLPKENYLIAAGKHYRPYNDDRDKLTQYSTIKQIHVPKRYKGSEGNYEADIAVLVLNRGLIFTTAVQPVCIDWNNEFEYEQLINNNKAIVVGWSYSQKGELSLELRELTVPYISYDKCFESVPLSYRRYLTYDKICAGYLSKGIGVCQGDNGGGLTFQRKSNERYYIRGILSLSPVTTNATCDLEHYAGYTSISKHLDFIKDVELTNRT